MIVASADPQYAFGWKAEKPRRLPSMFHRISVEFIELAVNIR